MAFTKKWSSTFNPASDEPFVLSRSKIDLFMECARCFYLDRRLGIGRPPSFPFTLNNAVDLLFKKEFDIHRALGSTHPLMTTYGIRAVPFADDRLEEWRDALRRGIKALHEPTNLLIRGGIDDVWQNDKGELHIVDYKATAKPTEVNLDADWQISYKRQVEVYHWLFRQNGFKVSPTAYFVYANGSVDRKAFDGKLEFRVTVLPYDGDDSWIPETLRNIKRALLEDELPEPSEACSYCSYRNKASAVEKKVKKSIQPSIF
jgi:hypothetical protein